MKKGFTLLELMVTIGILTILLGISVGGFALLKRRGDLNIAALQVKDFILQAKTEARSGRELKYTVYNVIFNNKNIILKGQEQEMDNCTLGTQLSSLELSTISPTISITSGTNKVIQFKRSTGEGRVLLIEGSSCRGVGYFTSLILTDTLTNKKIIINFDGISGRVDVGTPY